MKTLNILFLLFLLIVFMTGMYMHVFQLFIKNAEPMESQSDADCPDILINKGDTLLLYNSKMKEIDGINPIPFFNLDEYINHLEVQRRKGIRCPVLYAQKENDAQGNDVYRIRPSPFDTQGGLPTPIISNEEHPRNPVDVLDATRDNPPYNIGNYPSFDPMGLDIGKYTVVDKVHDSTKMAHVSDNPADTNWGGILYTENAIESGKYDENAVIKPVLTTPKSVMIYPMLYNNSRV